MIQSISANYSLNFRNKSQPRTQQKQAKQDVNPISRKGEAMKLVAVTFLGGLAFAGKLVLELAENGDFIIETFAKKAKKVAEKKGQKIDEKAIMQEAKKQAKDSRTLKVIGAFVGILAAFFAGVALLYTAFHAPKIAYESKVNTFKRSKEMDVYIKSNEAERELYTQLDEKAKQSNAEEKTQLKALYLYWKILDEFKGKGIV